MVMLILVGSNQKSCIQPTRFTGVDADRVCDSTEFRCTSGQCIKKMFRCDAEPDCVDESDEEECGGTICDQLEFRCQTSGQCISKSYVCDGESDCPDGSDESAAECSSILQSTNLTGAAASSGICDYTQFQCRTRTGANCIPRLFICDEDRDCLDGSDELNCSYCVKPILETQQPECKVTFYKGIYRDVDSWSCLNGPNQNAFRVKASLSHTPETADPFADPKVSYMQIFCVAPYGIDFRFEGVGAIETFRIWKSQKTVVDGGSRGYQNGIGYQTHVETVVTPSGTGNYIFRNLQDPTKEVSFFIHVENDKKPYLIGHGRKLNAKRLKVNNQTTEQILLPCISSKLNQTVFLFKEVETSWTRIEDGRYDPMQGFIFNMSPSLPGKYHCTTDEGHQSDLDLLTVIVDPTIVAHSVLPPTEPNIKIVLGNGGGATCHTINSTMASSNNEILTFTNLHASNPAEAMLSANCFTKGYRMCGSSPSISNHHIPTTELDSRNSCGKGLNGQKCARMQTLYSQGVLVCQLGEEMIYQEYFVGLDMKLYRTYEEAPLEALMKVELPNVPNNTSLTASTVYTMSCHSIGMEFARNPLTLTAKYGRSNAVEKLSLSVATIKYIRLKAGPVELTCSDHLWRTNEIRSVSVNVTVAERDCAALEFKCDNGECIRYSYRCDGDNDCADATDERNCPARRLLIFTPFQLGCTSSQFRCGDGTCKPLSYKCDGDRDCWDGSDELGCPNKATTTTTTTTTQRPKPEDCTSKEFQCSNGKCIALNFQCDEENDCGDNSDEIWSECASKTHTKEDIRTDAGSFEREKQGGSGYITITIVCIVAGLLVVGAFVAFRIYKIRRIANYGRTVPFQREGHDHEDVLMD